MPTQIVWRVQIFVFSLFIVDLLTPQPSIAQDNAQVVTVYVPGQERYVSGKVGVPIRLEQLYWGEIEPYGDRGGTYNPLFFDDVFIPVTSLGAQAMGNDFWGFYIGGTYLPNFEWYSKYLKKGEFIITLDGYRVKKKGVQYNESWATYFHTRRIESKNIKFDQRYIYIEYANVNIRNGLMDSEKDPITGKEMLYGKIIPLVKPDSRLLFARQQLKRKEELTGERVAVQVLAALAMAVTVRNMLEVLSEPISVSLERYRRSCLEAGGIVC